MFHTRALRHYFHTPHVQQFTIQQFTSLRRCGSLAVGALSGSSLSHPMPPQSWVKPLLFVALPRRRLFRSALHNEAPAKTAKSTSFVAFIVAILLRSLFFCCCCCCCCSVFMQCCEAEINPTYMGEDYLA